MNLTENEKRMVYQVESTCQAAILNEIAMNKRYAPNPEIRQTAESLLSKLRLLSDKECMALVNDVQKNYRLPGKARTIGEMLAEARQKSGAEKLAGQSRAERRGTVRAFGPDRADILPAGLFILLSWMESAGIPTVRVSDRGLRFGIAARELGLARPAAFPAGNG